MRLDRVAMFGIAAHAVSAICRLPSTVTEQGQFVRNVAVPSLAVMMASGTLTWEDAGAIEPSPESRSQPTGRHEPQEPRRFVPRWVPPATVGHSEPTSADEELPPPTRTPMEEDVAAVYIASAWHSIVGTPIDHSTLAVLWSHWALETGRGQRMVRYNFAGLKGTAPAGGSVQLWTQEMEDEAIARVRRRFRAYSSPEEGARDYIQLLKTRYPRALRAASRGSPIDFVRALEEGNYFTENPERYLRAVISLWREFLQEQVAQAVAMDPLLAPEG